MMAYPPVVMAHTVALFLSFDGELDTQPLIEQLWRAGKKVYLPVLHPFSEGNLLFLHYHPHSELVVNRLKITEPKLDVRDVLPLSQLDVLITPLVAFDEQGQRLGMGGGFYDRTLQNWQQYGLQPVGYAHDCQGVEALPVEKWDVPLPAVVTPSKLGSGRIKPGGAATRPTLKHRSGNVTDTTDRTISKADARESSPESPSCSAALSRPHRHPLRYQ
jgi:5-formyltetrahydrofolate cyclo-ligase